MRILGVSVLLIFSSIAFGCFKGSEEKTEKMEEQVLGKDGKPLEVATFGTGCFWCTEAVFESLEGVTKVVSGYSGGHVEKPTYKAVCEGTTGHAECVQITFDPSKISYVDLLEMFFRSHDPTSLNRQGADVGTQYRSVIFYNNEKQRELAHSAIVELTRSGSYSKPIVTELKKAPVFYVAEEYHQNYFARNPEQGYCAAVIAPKMEKFRKVFKDKLKKNLQ